MHSNNTKQPLVLTLPESEAAALIARARHNGTSPDHEASMALAYALRRPVSGLFKPTSP
jgi:hypothetical protein